MSRYIDAEWLKELYKPYESFNGKEYSVPIGAILANIDDAPSIEIIRCGECKYGEYREDYDDYLCRDDGICVHDADWFCADGERNSSEKPNNSNGEE